MRFLLRPNSPNIFEVTLPRLDSPCHGLANDYVSRSTIVCPFLALLHAVAVPVTVATVYLLRQRVIVPPSNVSVLLLVSSHPLVATVVPEPSQCILRRSVNRRCRLSPLDIIVLDKLGVFLDGKIVAALDATPL